MVAEGQPAPDFELATGEGETVALSSLRGKPVVLPATHADEVLALAG